MSNLTYTSSVRATGEHEAMMLKVCTSGRWWTFRSARASTGVTPSDFPPLLLILYRDVGQSHGCTLRCGPCAVHCLVGTACAFVTSEGGSLAGYPRVLADPCSVLAVSSQCSPRREYPLSATLFVCTGSCTELDQYRCKQTAFVCTVLCIYRTAL